MQGLEVFFHAIGMVVKNLGTAIRISAVLMALQFVLAIVLGAQFLYMVGGAGSSVHVPAGAAAAAAALSLLQVLSALWISVAWHRFILTDERPTGILPPFHGAAILSYLVAGIIFVLVLMVVALPTVFVSGILFAPLIAEATIIGELMVFAVVWIPTSYVAFRISPILPSSALGERLPLREAWYATGTSGLAFFVLAVVSGIAAWALNLPAFFLGGFSTLLAFVWNFGVQWLMLMVSISVLTTIFGHYVEKRALND